MEEAQRKKGSSSGQIPAFGDWERANQLPITQYFESAVQAGLIRHSSSSGECGPHYFRGGDLYAVDHLFRKPPPPPPTKRWVGEKKSGPHVKERKTQQKFNYVTDPPRKPKQPHHQRQCQQKHSSTSMYNNNVNNNYYGNEKKDVAKVQRAKLPVKPPKPVDEDLYKIPPELLHSSKRKKMPGLFSCLLPVCAS